MRFASSAIRKSAYLVVTANDECRLMTASSLGVGAAEPRNYVLANISRRTHGPFISLIRLMLGRSCLHLARHTYRSGEPHREFDGTPCAINLLPARDRSSSLSRYARGRFSARTTRLLSAALRQETTLVGKLLWQIVINNEIKAPFGKRLLLGTNSHMKQLLDCGDPLGMSHNKRIVL